MLWVRPILGPLAAGALAARLEPCARLAGVLQFHVLVEAALAAVGLLAVRALEVPFYLPGRPAQSLALRLAAAVGAAARVLRLVVALRLAPSRDVDAAQSELEVRLAGLVVLRLNQGAATPELLDLILSLGQILQDLRALVESHKRKLSVAQVRLEVLQNASAVGQVRKKSPKTLVYFFQRQVLCCLAAPAILLRKGCLRLLLGGLRGAAHFLLECYSGFRLD